jgi:two-component system, sensor histidine kinase ChiS
MLELLMLLKYAGIWEWLVYTILVVIVVYFVRRYELGRLKLRERLKLEMVKNDSMAKIDKLKSHFFADISHELRTPLTLVIGQIESVIDTANPDEKSRLKIAQKHGSRLLLLIDQLLELSKLDAHSIEIRPSEHDIVSFIRSLFYSFEPIAVSRDITLEFKCNDDTICALFDPDKLEQAICNLISNAFKFTGSPGLITIEVRKDGLGFLEIKVGDNGPGIDEGDISFLFSRFYRGEGAIKRKNQGAGIGLAIAKELVELHKGTISVENKPTSGAVFTIRIPHDLTIVRKETSITGHSSDQMISALALIDQLEPTLTEPIESMPVILIVEDNDDVRSFIRQQLQDDYRIQEAVDGIEGINIAQEKVPDLIISDLMMPEADGFQLCRELRKDFRTSHIPIIMLTARSGIDDKLEGLSKGIDEYITKPFNSRELKARVKNLIVQRDLLRSRFSTSTIFKPSEVTTVPLDQIFLEKVLSSIERNMEDHAYSIEMIASEMNMSISQLNRKLHALVGQPAGHILRSMRLQRAADMLKKKTETVAGICYAVGFNDHAYFSRAFKKQFGCTPSEYMK